MSDPELTIRAATEADVRDFALWRYGPPFDVYSITQSVEASIEYFLRPSTGCHVIVEADQLAGFCTFGSDAQVPGGDYSDPGLDIGLGMKPSLTGGGRGRHFVESTVEFASTMNESGPLRVTIATENRRAVRVWLACGFTEIARFRSPQTVMGSDEFVVLVAD